MCDAHLTCIGSDSYGHCCSIIWVSRRFVVLPLSVLRYVFHACSRFVHEASTTRSSARIGLKRELGLGEQVSSNPTHSQSSSMLPGFGVGLRRPDSFCRLHFALSSASHNKGSLFQSRRGSKWLPPQDPTMNPCFMKTSPRVRWAGGQRPLQGSRRRHGRALPADV